MPKQSKPVGHDPRTEPIILIAPPVAAAIRLEDDDPEFRRQVEKDKLADAVAYIRSAVADGTASTECLIV